MKRILLLINFLILAFALQAQENLNYQLNGKNIEFTISQEEIYVEFTPIQRVTIQQQAKQGFTDISKNSAIVKIPEIKGSFQEQKQNVQSKFSFNLKRIEPVLIYRDGTKQIAKGELNIKLKTNVSIDELFKDSPFTAQENEFEKDLYLVKLNLGTSELFELVNQLQKDDRIKFAEPNFTRIIKPHTSDPFLSSQWSINNQGYLGGTVDADMDVDDAWSYATGTGIKVAVIDEGVDLSHPDLTPNLLSGYDATGNGSSGAPNESNNDAHGTACAGIIAGSGGNNVGIAGVAYNAKIIPVRVAYSVSPTSATWITNDNWITNGINWAWQNGADVLSNSYGGGSYSSTIVSAINNAVNNGRNGKGSIVLFSSGNDSGGNGDPVSFPATVASAISVGASSMCDTRKNLSSCDGESWGSNFGNSLDIVAPGVKIYTTDISGSAGYSSGDYKSDFNGTSSACPNAAGVVALILSANPNLTQQEAREILESSVDKVNGYSYSNTSSQPNGTWNNQVGYGRVNAYAAVQAAQQSLASISGPEIICYSNTTFNLQGGNNPTWSKSYNLTIVSSTNNSITVKASNSTVGGQGYVRATFANNTFVQKDFWVGKANVDHVSFSDGFNEQEYFCSNDDDDNYKYYLYPSFSYNSGVTHQIRLRKYPNLNIVYQPFQIYSGDDGTIDYNPTPGWYLFEVKRFNSCGESEWFGDEVEFVECTNGGGGEGDEYEYYAYPNPSSERITIQKKGNDINNTEGNKIEYKFFDFNANLIYRDFITNGKATIDVSNLKKGRYILKIYGTKEEEAYHIIVE